MLQICHFANRCNVTQGDRKVAFFLVMSKWFVAAHKNTFLLLLTPKKKIIFLNLTMKHTVLGIRKTICRVRLCPRCCKQSHNKEPHC